MSKILRVNMSTLSVVTEKPKEDYRLLGGRAFIAKYMLTEVKATCEPLGRHNLLIFTPGLLGGSMVFSSGRISIGGKSPLTGGIKESNGGGVVGIKLARLGYPETRGQVPCLRNKGTGSLFYSNETRGQVPCFTFVSFTLSALYQINYQKDSDCKNGQGEQDVKFRSRLIGILVYLSFNVLIPDKSQYAH